MVSFFCLIVFETKTKVTLQAYGRWDEVFGGETKNPDDQCRPGYRITLCQENDRSFAFGFFLVAFVLHHLFPALLISSMDTESQRLNGRDGAPSLLLVAIEVLKLAKEISSIIPAKVVFGSASILLAMIRVSFLSKHVYWSTAG